MGCHAQHEQTRAYLHNRGIQILIEWPNQSLAGIINLLPYFEKIKVGSVLCIPPINF
jgi:hypothetical protein